MLHLPSKHGEGVVGHIPEDRLECSEGAPCSEPAVAFEVSSEPVSVSAKGAETVANASDFADSAAAETSGVFQDLAATATCTPTSSVCSAPAGSSNCSLSTGMQNNLCGFTPQSPLSCSVSGASSLEDRQAVGEQLASTVAVKSESVETGPGISELTAHLENNLTSSAPVSAGSSAFATDPAAFQCLLSSNLVNQPDGFAPGHLLNALCRSLRSEGQMLGVQACGGPSEGTRSNAVIDDPSVALQQPPSGSEQQDTVNCFVSAAGTDGLALPGGLCPSTGQVSDVRLLLQQEAAALLGATAAAAASARQAASAADLAAQHAQLAAAAVAQVAAAVRECHRQHQRTGGNVKEEEADACSTSSKSSNTCSSNSRSNHTGKRGGSGSGGSSKKRKGAHADDNNSAQQLLLIGDSAASFAEASRRSCDQQGAAAAAAAAAAATAAAAAAATSEETLQRLGTLLLPSLTLGHMPQGMENAIAQLQQQQQHEQQTDAALEAIKSLLNTISVNGVDNDVGAGDNAQQLHDVTQQQQLLQQHQLILHEQQQLLQGQSLKHPLSSSFLVGESDTEDDPAGTKNAVQEGPDGVPLSHKYFSKVPGVSYRATPHCGWRFRWKDTETGREYSRCFSVNKFGFDEAKRLAEKIATEMKDGCVIACNTRSKIYVCDVREKGESPNCQSPERSRTIPLSDGSVGVESVSAVNPSPWATSVGVADCTKGSQGRTSDEGLSSSVATPASELLTCAPGASGLLVSSAGSTPGNPRTGGRFYSSVRGVIFEGARGCWRGVVVDPTTGKQVVRRFSARKYGHSEAQRRAEEFCIQHANRRNVSHLKREDRLHALLQRQLLSRHVVLQEQQLQHQQLLQSSGAAAVLAAQQQQLDALMQQQGQQLMFQASQQDGVLDSDGSIGKNPTMQELDQQHQLLQLQHEREQLLQQQRLLHQLLPEGSAHMGAVGDSAALCNAVALASSEGLMLHGNLDPSINCVQGDGVVCPPLRCDGGFDTSKVLDQQKDGASLGLLQCDSISAEDASASAVVAAAMALNDATQHNDTDVSLDQQAMALSAVQQQLLSGEIKHQNQDLADVQQQLEAVTREINSVAFGEVGGTGSVESPIQDITQSVAAHVASSDEPTHEIATEDGLLSGANGTDSRSVLLAG